MSNIDTEFKTSKAKLLCCCNSFEHCGCMIEITPEDWLNMQDAKEIMISDDCINGPEPDDVFTRQEDGYKVYKDCQQNG